MCTRFFNSLSRLVWTGRRFSQRFCSGGRQDFSVGKPTAGDSPPSSHFLNVPRLFDVRTEGKQAKNKIPLSDSMSLPPRPLWRMLFHLQLIRHKDCAAWAQHVGVTRKCSSYKLFTQIFPNQPEQNLSATAQKRWTPSVPHVFKRNKSFWPWDRDESSESSVADTIEFYRKNHI